MINDPIVPNDAPGDFITDEQLTAMALAADPNPVIDLDAVPWSPSDPSTLHLLPNWYMPTPLTRRRGSWPMVIASVVIIGFLVIDAFGLCITSGFLSWA